MNTRQHLDLSSVCAGGHSGGVTAAPFYSNPVGSLDGAGEGVNALSTSPVLTIDTQSEPGSWLKALPYKFRTDTHEQGD